MRVRGALGSITVAAFLIGCSSPTVGGSVESTNFSTSVVAPTTTETTTTGTTTAATSSTTTSSTTTSSTTTVAPRPTMHHEPTGWDDWPDCPTDPATVVAPGDRLAVPGHDDRPTLLQTSFDPTGPLIVVFHGQNGCIEKVQGQTDLEEIATGWGVNVLWLSGAPVPTRSWNTNGRCCEPASTRDVDDLPYVEAAVAAAIETGLQPSRIVAIGKSNGAGMAVTAGCRLPMLFDVVVSIAGWAPIGCDRADLSLFVEVGTDDEVFEVSDSRAIVDRWLTDVVTCEQPPVEETRERARVTTWRCGEQFVRFAVVDGMGHLWPTWSWFNADEEILRIALAELPAD